MLEFIQDTCHKRYISQSNVMRSMAITSIMPILKKMLAIFHNNRNHFRMCIFIGCIAIKKKQMCPQIFLIETF